MGTSEKVSSFWLDPAGYRGATEEELVAAEKRLGYPLPRLFRKLLLLRDGGISNFQMFDDILFSPVRGVSGGAGTGSIVELYVAGGEEHLPDGAIIFAGDASAWFAFDFREGPESPRILHWSEYEDGPFELAGSFELFLDGLT